MIKINGKPVTTEHFPNKETKVKDFAAELADKNCTVELKYEDDKDLVTLMFVKGRLDDFNIKSNLFIAYMPYSRMDRQIEGDLFTLKYAADYISKLGFNKVTVMEPHSQKTVDLLQSQGMNVLDIYPTKKWVKDITAREQFTPKDHIVFPDQGAMARYANPEFSNILTFEKRRNPQTGRIQEIELSNGTVNKRSKCLIQDDLCSKGGTFMGVGDKLKTAGAGKVVLLVAHCEDAIFDGGVLKQDSPIDKVFTTRSILRGEHPKIEIIDYSNEITGER